MAERRMFAKSIIDSDVFLDMPLSTQALYFHLSMRADDDGFVSNPKRIKTLIGASEDDLKLLILKRYILSFDSGIIVIKHWKMHNYIQSDRYKPTTYIEEKNQLQLDNKKAYVECIQNVYKLDTQDRIGKDRIGKDNISLTCASDLDESLSTFCNKYDIQIDSCSPLIVEMDFNLVTKAFEESEYLRTDSQCKFLSTIIKRYQKIIKGFYKDKEKPQKEKADNWRGLDNLQELYKQHLMEEEE